jgi:ElaB/YqjD/DUF883 family membrane-anchored ribosome-binding protein
MSEWSVKMMNCRSARESILDRQASSLSPQETAALDRHLESCASCRREAATVAALWASLGTDAVSAASPEMVERVRARITAASQEAALAANTRATLPSHDRHARRRPWMAAAAGAGLAAGLVLGFLAGRSVQSAATLADNSPQYLLLLHGGPPEAGVGQPAVASVVQEYVAWAQSLSEQGRLVSAEKLADAPIASVGSRQLDDSLGGFFLVRARDMSEAIRIAEESPHARHGGRIEVRLIERT